MEVAMMTKEKAENLGIEYCPHGQPLPCTPQCFYRRMLLLIGKKYTLDMIRFFVHNPVARFNQIAKEIGGSPKTVTDRLNELCREGILKREAFAEIPPRVEYSLTEKGLALKPIMDEIRAWGEKWGAVR
jgi:DNA-binding HxlR family transcriptional regulator